MDKKVLEAAGLLFEQAYHEDIGDGDITTNNLIPEGKVRIAQMVAKEDGVVAGLPVVEMVFRRFDPGFKWIKKIEEGEDVNKGDVIAEFSADYRALLTGERIALNFLQRLCGIATITRRFKEQTRGTRTRILDTRKTLPGFRLLDKYAVKAGGGQNHRIGLYDMVMIKDNHIQIAGGIQKAVTAIRGKIASDIQIEVETTSLDEVKEALEAGADIIMLDNMSTDEMKTAVEIINKHALVEASGNMTLERIAEVAETGVDFISVGALTHSVAAMDISQKIKD